MSQVFDKVIRDIEQNCQQLLNSVTSTHLGLQLQGVIDAILVARTNRDVPSSSALVQKVVMKFFPRLFFFLNIYKMYLFLFFILGIYVNIRVTNFLFDYF